MLTDQPGTLVPAGLLTPDELNVIPPELDRRAKG